MFAHCRGHVFTAPLLSNGPTYTSHYSGISSIMSLILLNEWDFWSLQACVRTNRFERTSVAGWIWNCWFAQSTTEVCWVPMESGTTDSDCYCHWCHQRPARPRSIFPTRTWRTLPVKIALYRMTLQTKSESVRGTECLLKLLPHYGQRHLQWWTPLSKKKFWRLSLGIMTIILLSGVKKTSQPLCRLSLFNFVCVKRRQSSKI